MPTQANAEHDPQHEPERATQPKVVAADVDALMGKQNPLAPKQQVSSYTNPLGASVEAIMGKYNPLNPKKQNVSSYTNPLGASVEAIMGKSQSKTNEARQKKKLTQKKDNLPKDLVLMKWIFVDSVRQQRSTSGHKVEGSCALIFKGNKTTAGADPVQSKAGKITAFELNTTKDKKKPDEKSKKAFGKYSRKLLDLNISGKGLSLPYGIKVKAGVGVLDFKTSVKDAKGLKSDGKPPLKGLHDSPKQHRMAKGIGGLGFDMDFLNLSIKVEVDLNPQNIKADHPFIQMVSGLPWVVDLVKKNIPLTLQAEVKISLIGHDLDVLKRQKKKLANIDQLGKQYQEAAAEVDHIKKEQKLLNQYRKKHQKYLNLAKNDAHLKSANQTIQKLQQELKGLDKEYQEVVKARRAMALDDAKKVPLQNRPAKSFADDNPAKKARSKPMSGARKEIKQTIQSIEVGAQKQAKVLAQEVGLHRGIPQSMEQMTKEVNQLKQQLAIRKHNAQKLRNKLIASTKQLAGMSKEYTTELGKYIGQRTLAFTGRLLAHFNIAMEVIDALALLVAFALAPDKATTIFSGKPGMSSVELLTTLALERREADEHAKTSHTTTDVRKSGTEDSTGTTGKQTSAKKNTPKNAKKNIKNTPHQGQAQGSKVKDLLEIIKKNDIALKIWGKLLIDGLMKGQEKTLFKTFTLAHAHELVRIAQRYGHHTEIWDTLKQHSQALDKARHSGNIDTFLQSLEGTLQRELGQASQKQDPKALEVDRENQLVIHDKGLENEKKRLQGTADRAEEISTDTVTYKPEGVYTITDIKDGSYKIGTKLELQFVGTYHGKPALFKEIIVKVVNTPLTKGKTKYVEVEFPYNQYLEVKGSNRKVYFLKKSGSFHVKIK